MGRRTSSILLLLAAIAIPPALSFTVRHPSMIYRTATELGSFRSVEAVLFDIDGTLANSWKLGFDATVVVLERNDIATITEDVYHHHTRYATPDRMARHAGYTPEDGDAYDEVGERLGREFDELYVDLVSTETAGFFPGVREMIEDIPSTVKLGVLTNACAGYAHAVLNANCEVNGDSPEFRKERFLSIRGADDVPAPKPSGDGVLFCCKEMGVDPEKCVYIGDSPSDGMAANAAGIPSIGVVWGSHSLESLKTAPFQHIATSVEELGDLLPRRTSKVIA